MSEDTKQPGPSALAVEAAIALDHKFDSHAWAAGIIQSAIDRATAPLAQEVERLRGNLHTERLELCAVEDVLSGRDVESHESGWSMCFKVAQSVMAELRNDRADLVAAQRELAQLREEFQREAIQASTGYGEQTSKLQRELAEAKEKLDQEKSKSEQDALAHFQTEQKLKAERSQLTSVVEEQRQEIEALRKCVADLSDLDNTKLALEAVRKENEGLKAMMELESNEVCQTCNWTNMGCLNIGDVGREAWICHGCIKRTIDHLRTSNAELAAKVEEMREALEKYPDNSIEQTNRVKAALATPPSDALKLWAKPLVDAIKADLNSPGGPAGALREQMLAALAAAGE